MARAAAAKAPKKADVKTTKTAASVEAFLAAVEGDGRRADALAIDAMMREVTGETPAMWGAAIVGYGGVTNTTSAGQAEWPKMAFSPRKANLVLYLDPELLASDPLMERLGAHSCGKSCLYIKRLADVDERVLRTLTAKSWTHASNRKR